MHVIRAGTLPLEAETLSTGYSGPQAYRGVTALATADGALSLGVWEYEGRLESSNPGAGHQLWIVLDGDATISMGDEHAYVGRGDTVVFEAPYGSKTVEASAGFRAIWVAVPVRASD